MNRIVQAVLISVFLSTVAVSAAAGERALGYLSVPGSQTFAGGGPIPVYESLDDVERSALRYDRASFYLCEVLDNTLVEISEEDRERVEFLGAFIKVRILEGTCQDKTGWVSISHVHRMLP